MRNQTTLSLLNLPRGATESGRGASNNLFALRTAILGWMQTGETYIGITYISNILFLILSRGHLH